jgi:phytoene synthase
MSAATPLGLAPADLDATTEIVRRAGTSFYRGMRVLPPDRRHAMYAIYAFCRLVDDIADEDAPLAEKTARLDEWRETIAGLYAGRPGTTDVTRVLAAAIAAYDLREADFLAVIDGMAMDAGDPIVAPPLATLDLYCDRVASAVGRLSVRAFGDASADADAVAHGLGRALQLTNILRDIAEDAERGRLYLPAEYLADAGIPPRPEAVVAAPALPAVCRRLAALAHAHFDAAHAAMARCDPRAMKPARLMGATYGAILVRLERSGWADPARRVSLPTWQKLWLAARYGLA